MLKDKCLQPWPPPPLPPPTHRRSEWYNHTRQASSWRIGIAQCTHAHTQKTKLCKNSRDSTLMLADVEMNFSPTETNMQQVEEVKTYFTI